MKNCAEDDARTAHDGFESNHCVLGKAAYEALVSKTDNIARDKSGLLDELGGDFYRYLVRIGILVEDNFLDLSKPFSSTCMYFKKVVRFYHKILCKWYAAHYVKDIAEHGTPGESKNCLHALNSDDHKYVFTFACGLDRRAADVIVRYLINEGSCLHLAIMCFMENSMNFGDRTEVVKDLCQIPIDFKSTYNTQQENTILRFLALASRENV